MRCFLGSAEGLHYLPGEEIVMRENPMKSVCIATLGRLDGDPADEVKVTQLDLSDMAEASHEAISRMIARTEGDGIVQSGGGQFQNLDLESLKRFSRQTKCRSSARLPPQESSVSSNPCGVQKAKAYPILFGNPARLLWDSCHWRQMSVSNTVSVRS